MAHALRRGAQAAAACAVCGLLGALWGTSDWAPALIPTSRGTPRRASAPPAAAPALASLVPVVEVASAPARTTGRLVGRVLDEDQRPLGGAELLLLRRGGGALTLPPTAPDGGFAASLDPGDYVLGVELDGAAPAGFELVDAEGQRLETVRVTSGATCTLEVRAHLAHAVQVAVLGAGGEPIPRASVTLEGDPGTYLRRGPARTDAGGRCALGVVPRGRYALRVEARGYLPRRLVVQVANDDPLSVRLERGAELRGRVLRPGGAPAEGAWVFAVRDGKQAGSARADEQGRFVLRSLTPGVFQVYALEREGGLSARCEAAPGDAPCLTLAPGPVLAGRVRTSLGAPCGGATLSAREASLGVLLRATADSDGRFACDPAPPGRYEVRVDLPALGVRSVYRATVDLDQDRTLEVALPGTARVAGVLLGAEGQPLAHARVSVERADAHFAHTVTDAEGAFELPVLLPGDAVLLAETTRAPVEYARVGLRLAADERRHVTLVAEAAGVIVGRLVDPRGTPLAGVRWEARGPRGFSEHGSTGHDGGFRTASVLPDRYTLRFDGAPVEAVQVQVAPGDVVELEVRARAD